MPSYTFQSLVLEHSGVGRANSLLSLSVLNSIMYTCLWTPSQQVTSSNHSSLESKLPPLGHLLGGDVSQWPAVRRQQGQSREGALPALAGSRCLVRK